MVFSIAITPQSASPLCSALNKLGKLSHITKSWLEPKYFDVANDTVKGLLMGFQQVADMQQYQTEVSQNKRRQFRKASTQNIKSLNTTWLNEMTTSDAQLREKMALFWHGHFATGISKVGGQNLDLMRQQNDLFRSQGCET